MATRLETLINLKLEEFMLKNGYHKELLEIKQQIIKEAENKKGE